MKKILLLVAFAISIIACNKTPEAKEFKTAYIDTVKMMEEYNEAKEIGDKFKTKGEVLTRELELEIKKFKAEAANFQQTAQAKGQAWAQEKGAQLQQKQQQLQYAQQSIDQQIQQEGAKEMDTVVKSVKSFIKDYGKQKGYDYIYGTGDAPTVLYAKDSYDITKEITKALNDKYATKPKTEKKEDKEKK
jgi:outer membrane protein